VELPERLSPTTVLLYMLVHGDPPQRTIFGCSLLVLQVYVGTGEFSPPLLVIAGPIALPSLGENYENPRDLWTLCGRPHYYFTCWSMEATPSLGKKKREIFGLSADDPLPKKLDDMVDLPERLTLTAVSLAPAYCARTQTLTSLKALDEMRSDGRCPTPTLGQVTNTREPFRLSVDSSLAPPHALGSEP
jgi:hypothetical protein